MIVLFPGSNATNIYANIIHLITKMSFPSLNGNILPYQ